MRRRSQIADLAILLLAGTELPPSSLSPAAAAAAVGADAPEPLFGRRGDVALALLRAQGLPSLAVAAQARPATALHCGALVRAEMRSGCCFGPKGQARL